MKKMFKKIKDKIDTYIQTNRILKNQIKNKNETIDIQARNIDALIIEKNEYRDKSLKLEKEKTETKQQLRDLTKRDKKLQQIEELFEGKKVTIKDISKILDGEE